MALVFHRGLAVPLWAIAFVAVALTAPPQTALFLILLGVAVMTVTMSDQASWLWPYRSVVQQVSRRSRDASRHAPAGDRAR